MCYIVYVRATVSVVNRHVDLPAAVLSDLDKTLDLLSSFMYVSKQLFPFSPSVRLVATHMNEPNAITPGLPYAHAN